MRFILGVGSRKQRGKALRGQGFDMLLVLGFAFDASAVTTAEEFRPDGSSDFAAVQEERRPCRLRVLIVRMKPTSPLARRC